MDPPGDKKDEEKPKDEERQTNPPEEPQAEEAEHKPHEEREHKPHEERETKSHEERQIKPHQEHVTEGALFAAMTDEEKSAADQFLTDLNLHIAVWQEEGNRIKKVATSGNGDDPDPHLEAMNAEGWRSCPARSPWGQKHREWLQSHASKAEKIKYQKAGSNQKKMS